MVEVRTGLAQRLPNDAALSVAKTTKYTRIGHDATWTVSKTAKVVPTTYMTKGGEVVVLTMMLSGLPEGWRNGIYSSHSVDSDKCRVSGIAPPTQQQSPSLSLSYPGIQW